MVVVVVVVDVGFVVIGVAVVYHVGIIFIITLLTKNKTQPYIIVSKIKQNK